MKIRLLIVGALSAGLIYAYLNDMIPTSWLQKADSAFRSGLALMESNNFKDAAAKLEGGQEMAKENAAFFYNLFVCYEKLKDDKDLTDAERKAVTEKSATAMDRYLALKSKESTGGAFEAAATPKVTTRAVVGGTPAAEATASEAATPETSASGAASSSPVEEIAEFEGRDPAVGKALSAAGRRYADRTRQAVTLSREALDKGDMKGCEGGLEFALEYGRMANQAAKKAGHHIPDDGDLKSLQADLATLDTDIRSLFNDYRIKRDQK